MSEAIVEICERLLVKRRDRSYPRVVKRARHNSYRVKRASHAGRRYDGPPIVKVRHPALT